MHLVSVIISCDDMVLSEVFFIDKSGLQTVSCLLHLVLLQKIQGPFYIVKTLWWHWTLIILVWLGKKRRSSHKSKLTWIWLSFFRSIFSLLCYSIFSNSILLIRYCDLQESKSIGAEVNWGVRFKDVKDVGIPMPCQANFLFLFIIDMNG